jgi:hypothetical protein
VRPAASSLSVRLAAVVAVSTIATLGSAAASVAATRVSNVAVSSSPVSQTPHLVASSTQGGAVEQIRQLVQCGSMMYAVGSFTAIARNSTTYTREGAFSFSATSPYKVTSWDPEVNGTVNTIAFNGSDCTNAYLGGKFTTVGGTAAKNIADVSTVTGTVVPTFRATSAGEVDTMVGWNGHLLTGGIFTSINGSATDPYFTSLNPVTGKNDNYLALGISGSYVYTDQAGVHSSANVTRVFNQQLSPDGTRDLIEGDFTTVGGQPRQQVAVIDLGATAASIDGWYATEFNANCNYNEPMYAQSGAWSPDSATIYVADTGYKPASGPGYSTRDARAGLCDAGAAFPATPTQVSHLWISYTGCDSMYAAAADAGTVYFAGHFRWADNSHGCDAAGPGSSSAPGLMGLSPTDGSLAFAPGISRGLGADDMLVTSAGLWIASDNSDGSQSCGGVTGHAGICLLPAS